MRSKIGLSRSRSRASHWRVVRSTQIPSLRLQRGFPVNLPKLAFIAGDECCDRDRTFLGVPHQLVDVALCDDGLIFVVDQDFRAQKARRSERGTPE